MSNLFNSFSVLNYAHGAESAYGALIGFEVQDMLLFGPTHFIG